MALFNWTISNVKRRGFIPLTTPEIVRSYVAESSLTLKYVALSHCFCTEAGAEGASTRSRTSPIFASTLVALRSLLKLPSVERSYSSISYENQFIITSRSRDLSRRFYHDGRPRGSLWRGKKLIGKEALFVILGLKRVKDDEDNLNKFIKTHVSRLLKMDMIAVLVELERQDQVALALKVFMVIQKEDWYKPDAFLYKDLIVALARSGKMDDVMQLWESMKKENLFPDSQTYTEVIRGFLKCGSPEDAMSIYEDMKKSPDPPEELPFRTLLKGLLPHPLLRNKVKQEFEEIFPDSRMYDPPEEIFGLR